MRKFLRFHRRGECYLGIICLIAVLMTSSELLHANGSVELAMMLSRWWHHLTHFTVDVMSAEVVGMALIRVLGSGE